jgi:WD40 repeat protein
VKILESLIDGEQSFLFKFASLNFLNFSRRPKMKRLTTKRNRTARVYNFLQRGPLPIADLCDIVSFYAAGLEGDCRLVLQGHTRQVNALAILPDSKLASGSTDCTVRVWDTRDGTCLLTLSGHSKPVHALAALPGGHLASGANDKTVVMWDLVSGTRVRTLTGHSACVLALASLSGNQLASGSEDYTICVWDTMTGLWMRTLRGHSNWVFSLASLPNSRLASGSGDCTVRIWNLADGVCAKILTGHTSFVRALVVLRDGTLVSSALDGAVRAWDTEAGVCLHQANLGCDVHALAVLDGGALACNTPTSVVVWNLADGTPLLEIKANVFRFAIAALTHGELAVASDGGTVRVWE